MQGHRYRVVVAVAAGLLAATALVGVAGAGSVTPTSLTTCDESTFDQAVAGGGTVQFDVDCTTPLTHGVKIPSTLTVDIEANGHAATLNGQSQTRHFVVAGGKLTIGGITLTNGLVRGVAGTAGVIGNN